MLFSRMLDPRTKRSTAIEITAAGIDVAKVMPTFRPRYTLAAVNSSVITPPSRMPRSVSSRIAGLVVTIANLSSFPSLGSRDRADGTARRRVQGHSVTNERLERGGIDLLALMQVNGTPDVAVEAGVEQLRWILQLRAFGECHFDGVLVGLAGADHSVVIPDRDASPFPFLGDVRHCLFDQRADPRKHLAAPVAQFLDACVYHARW